MIVERMRNWYAGSWLGVPVKTSRGATIAGWALITGTAFGALWGSANLNAQIADSADERTYQLCVQRAEGRNAVRAIFFDLYDFVDPEGEDPEVNELRHRLDELLPALSVDDCPAP